MLVVREKLQAGFCRTASILLAEDYKQDTCSTESTNTGGKK